MSDEIRAVEYGDDEKFAAKQMEDLQTQLDNEDDEWTDPSMPDEPDMYYVLGRLDAIDARINELRDGVNTIGQMMNGVADAFGQIMEQVQKGGLGALLGGMMGGNKNG